MTKFYPPSKLKTPAPASGDTPKVKETGDTRAYEDTSPEDIPFGDLPTPLPEDVEDEQDFASAATVCPGELDQSQDSLIGKVLDDRYLVLKILGEGGMGAVYLVEHTTINKKFALKILHEELSSKDDLQERFLREARATAKVGHSNIVDITDFGTTPGGAAFFTMEHLKGQELAVVMRREAPFPWARAKPILVQICRALAAAHAQDVIHRDVKPGNIFLVQRDGTEEFVKVLDFGLSCMQDEDSGQRLTKTGMIFGSPSYMAPEQVDPKSVDHRADIYALGIVMYEMVTGMLPFEGDTPAAVLSLQLMDKPTPLAEAAMDITLPPGVEEIIMRAMARAPDDRYQSITEMEQAIQQIPNSLPRSSHKIRNVMGIAGALVLIAALVVVVLLSRSDPMDSERRAVAPPPPAAAPLVTTAPKEKPPSPRQVTIKPTAPDAMVHRAASPAVKSRPKRRARRRKPASRRNADTVKPTRPRSAGSESGELVNPFQ